MGAYWLLYINALEGGLIKAIARLKGAGHGKKEFFMKNKQFFLCGFLSVMSVLVFGACSATANAQEQRLTGGDSFGFTVISGGTAYRVRAGTAAEGTVSIPAYYRPNADSEYLPVTEIGWFSQRGNIIRITIPSTVTVISNGAFSKCTNLNSINIPEGVTSIGNRAFEDCTSLTTITIPSTVKSIGEYAFNGCINLTGGITVPEGVTSIRECTFFKCTSLTSITIPASVTSLGRGAFEGWQDTQTINIQGKANQAATDRAWGGSSWRENSSARINYGQ